MTPPYYSELKTCIAAVDLMKFKSIIENNLEIKVLKEEKPSWPSHCTGGIQSLGPGQRLFLQPKILQNFLNF